MKGRQHGTTDADRKRFGFLFGRTIFKWWARERERLVKELDARYSGMWHSHATTQNPYPYYQFQPIQLQKCGSCGAMYSGLHTCLNASGGGVKWE